MKIHWKDGSITEANAKSCRIMAMHALFLDMIEEVE